MTATEPAPLPLPDRLTVSRRIGYLLRELRVARRALTLVELDAANKSAHARDSQPQHTAAGGQR